LKHKEEKPWLYKVRESYETWVSQCVVPLFEKSGISITQNAQNLIAYTLQSHIEEKING